MYPSAKNTYAVVRCVIAARTGTSLVGLSWVPLEGCSAVWSLVHNSCLCMCSSFLGRSIRFIPNSQCRSVLLLLPKLVCSVLVQIHLFLLKSRLCELACRNRDAPILPFKVVRQDLQSLCSGDLWWKKFSVNRKQKIEAEAQVSTGTAASPVLWRAQQLPGCPCSLAPWLIYWHHGSADLSSLLCEDSSIVWNETACILCEIFMIQTVKL